MSNIKITTPQFERTWKLDFEYKPSTPEQFIETVKNAPYEILLGLGFCKWSSMNEVISENQKKPVSRVISLNTAKNVDELIDKIIEDGELTGPPVSFDIGRKDAPINLLEINEDILLIPGEWYNTIPNGFMVTGLHGEEYAFEKGKTDDDTRFGCLAYGIRRSLTPNHQ